MKNIKCVLLFSVLFGMVSAWAHFPLPSVNPAHYPADDFDYSPVQWWPSYYKKMTWIRSHYVPEVKALKATIPEMKEMGMSAEAIARHLSHERRAIGIKYKNMTPNPQRELIFERNMSRYGDPYGPSVDDLRAQGKSWDSIIKSTYRPEGAGVFGVGVAEWAGWVLSPADLMFEPEGYVPFVPEGEQPMKPDPFYEYSEGELELLRELQE